MWGDACGSQKVLDHLETELWVVMSFLKVGAGTELLGPLKEQHALLTSELSLLPLSNLWLLPLH